MSDAFDQWLEWRYKPAADRRSIPAELYAAVMSLPETDRSDRQRVNEVVRSHVERSGVRDDRRPAWAKLFGSIKAAEKWLEENDPTGKFWEYAVQE